MGGEAGSAPFLDAAPVWVDLRGKLPTRPGAAPYIKRSPEEMDNVAYTVFHHTHAGPGYPSVWATAEYHAGPSPMAPPGICYHVYIEEDGTAYLGNDLSSVTWHAGAGSSWSFKGVGGNNWLSVGVCLAGENPTGAQLVSARRVADAIDEAFGRKLKRVGHKELSVGLTECPGSLWESWKRDVGA